jgi:hypothetical protein
MTLKRGWERSRHAVAALSGDLFSSSIAPHLETDAVIYLFHGDFAIKSIIGTTHSSPIIFVIWFSLDKTRSVAGFIDQLRPCRNYCHEQSLPEHSQNSHLTEEVKYSGFGT